MPTLHLEIVTPEARIYQAEVEAVVVPGVEGELGILPHHVALMTQIVPGELRISHASQQLRMAVGEGFLDVLPHRVLILTDMAIDEADIDEHAAEKAVALAEQELKNTTLSHEEIATVQSSLLRSLAKIRVKRGRHY